MTIDHDDQFRLSVDMSLNHLASHERAQTNCMLQLALVVARIAVQPVSEKYSEEAAQALIRAKPKTKVVRLFGNKSTAEDILLKLNTKSHS